MPPLQRKLDNQTLQEKIALRKRALALLREWGIEQPIVCEAYGGVGSVWKACYAEVRQGVVFEKMGAKIDTLAKQRPSWSVYEVDCVVALNEGAGAHLAFDLLDIDPYGQCLPALRAFMTSERPRKDRMIVVTNDGGRQASQIGISWTIGELKSYVEKYGNDLYPIYRDVLDEAIRDLCALAGYRTTLQVSFYAGHQQSMCHCMTVVEKGT